MRERRRATGNATSVRDARAYITIVAARERNHASLLAETSARGCSLCLAIGSAGFGIPGLPGQSPATTRKRRMQPQADPLGRNTPSGTLYGFLQAAQSGNYSIAAQYLQMSAARRQTQGEDFASKLKVVIDRAFYRRPAADQQSTRGDAAGRNAARQAACRQSELRRCRCRPRFLSASLILKAGKIWLISSDTLARLPELYEQAAVHQVETHLPQFWCAPVSGTCRCGNGSRYCLRFRSPRSWDGWRCRFSACPGTSGRAIASMPWPRRGVRLCARCGWCWGR